MAVTTLRPWLSGLIITLLAVLVSAQSSNTTQLLIYDSSSTYHYIGCWNETTALPHTSGARALPDISLEQPGTMTVEVCLDFCAHNRSTAYKYAGLEYSRQCWCANRLSSLSTKLADSTCNTECDGNKTVACGGALKLSVYNLTSTGGANAGSRSQNVLSMMETITGAALAIVVVVGLL